MDHLHARLSCYHRKIGPSNLYGDLKIGLVLVALIHGDLVARTEKPGLEPFCCLDILTTQENCATTTAHYASTLTLSV